MRLILTGFKPCTVRAGIHYNNHMDDKIKKIPKPSITADEYQKMRAEADAASELMQDDRFDFFRKYLRDEKERIVSDFVNNKLKKTTIVEKGETTDHHIEFTREEQEREMSGRFKFIFEILGMIEKTIELPKEADKANAAGKVIIEGNGEKI